MENNSSNPHQRRILFLISLPQEVEFGHDNEDINECLQKVSELGADVHTHINQKVLSKAKYYDIVVVVAHRDPILNMLILSDQIMSMDEFVEMLPDDFSGVLDFSSCYSATAFEAIKRKCPNCKVQAAITETTLLRRLIIYPSLFELLIEETDLGYAEAYALISEEFDKITAKLKSGSSYSPSMTHLGHRMSSIYAPKRVQRKSPFQILLFFHYDSDKQAIEIKAKRWQTDSELRDEFILPIQGIDSGEINVNLSIDAWNEKGVILKGGEYSRKLALTDEMAIERFNMMVMPDFEENSFIVNMDFEADGIEFMHCSFNIEVVKDGEKANPSPATIVAETTSLPSEPHLLLQLYGKTCCQQWIGEQNIKSMERLLLSNEADTERLRAIRKLTYENRLFLKQIEFRTNKLMKYLTELLKSIDLNSRNASTDIVPIQILHHHTSKLVKKVDKLKKRFLKLSESGFSAAESKFHVLGAGFLMIASDINNIGNQFDMLRSFMQLKNLIQNKCGDKELIKTIASEFLEHPSKDSTDQPIYEIFKAGGTSSIKHSTSNGATLPYLALCIAMALGRYESVDHGKEDWSINVADYIDMSNVKTSLRTHKGRINKTLSLLNDTNVQEKISTYRLTDIGKISTTAYYIQKIKVSISKCSSK